MLDKKKINTDNDSGIQNRILTNPIDKKKYTRISYKNIDDYSKYALLANGIIFGGGLGVLFFLTSFSGTVKVIPNKYISTPFAIIFGIIDGVTNATLTMSATKQLFSVRLKFWFSTLIIFLLAGGTSSLPFVAVTMQATDVIWDNYGIDIRPCKEVFGNIALILYGILNSVGLSNLISTSYFTLSHILCKNSGDQLFQQRKYLDDQRSVDEYKKFKENPDNFIRDKFSRFNICILLASIMSLGYDYGVSGELPKALTGEHVPFLSKTFGFFNLIVINDYSKTDVGSKVVSCLTGTPLHASFVATTLRTLSRDIRYLFNEGLRKHHIKPILLIVTFLIFILITAITPILETLEAEGKLFLAMITMASAFLINYSGPRPLFFKMTNRTRLFSKSNYQSFDSDKFSKEPPAVQEMMHKKLIYHHKNNLFSRNSINITNSREVDIANESIQFN